jgi:hypothetical protein
MNGFDPGKAAQCWTDLDKFLALVVDQTTSGAWRGLAFLPPKAVHNAATDSPTH